MEDNFNINLLETAVSLEDLRFKFLDVTRNIFTSSITSEEKQKYRIISENKYDEIKSKLK